MDCVFVSGCRSVNLMMYTRTETETEDRTLTFGSPLSSCSWDLISLCFSIEKKMKELQKGEGKNSELIEKERSSRLLPFESLWCPSRNFVISGGSNSRATMNGLADVMIKSEIG